MGDTATTEVKEVLSRADVTWLCLPPQGILDFLAAYLGDFKPGSLVTDVCGVKTAIVDGAKCLPPSVDFIGCHPMAGKEVSGIAHAEGSLFRNAHFIITPQPGNTTEHLELMKRTASVAATEAAAEGICWTFASMVDVTRDARWGRVMEGAGEDPWYGSRVAVARVQGFQGGFVERFEED